MNILFIDGSGFLREEVSKALSSLGHRVFVESLDATERVSIWANRLFSRLLENKIELILTTNNCGFDRLGHIGKDLENCNMPIAIWFIDNPAFVIKDSSFSAPNTAVAFTWEKTTEKFLKRSGARWVHYLPLAANIDLQRNTPKVSNGEVVFVGNSMINAQNRFKRILSSSGRSIAEELSNCLLDGQRFDRLSEKDIEVSSRDNIWDVLALAAWTSTAKKRLELVKSIEGISVYGDRGWQEIAPKAKYRGQVRYGTELAKIYSESAIIINSTSTQMATAVNQRVFDVPLSGGFIINDNQEDMSQLFNLGNESVVYSNLDDLKSKIKLYKNNLEERQRIIENSKNRVLENHLYTDRLSFLLRETLKINRPKVDYSFVEKLLKTPK